MCPMSLCVSKLCVLCPYVFQNYVSYVPMCFKKNGSLISIQSKAAITNLTQNYASFQGSYFLKAAGKFIASSILMPVALPLLTIFTSVRRFF
jgi:hypothetical protein